MMGEIPDIVGLSLETGLQILNTNGERAINITYTQNPFREQLDGLYETRILRVTEQQTAVQILAVKLFR